MTDNDKDPALEQAFRAQSREEPPPALDAKILAAAHRAVASAPREATRPPRWWMPLAAAAVIGAVAIGVVQLAPQEPVLDTSPPAVTSLAKEQKEPDQAAPAATVPESPPAAMPAAPPPAVNAPKRSAPPKPAPMQEQKLATTAPAPESFPQKTEAADSRKDDRNERQAASPPPAAAPSPAPMAGPGRAMMRAQSDAATAAGAGSLAQNVAPAEQERRKARDPDAWIAEIRKMRDAGQNDDVVRELKAFRELVPDAERRLPPDLRDWKP